MRTIASQAPDSDEDAVGRGLGGEFAHQPALARARFAADQDDPAPFALGPRQQRPQGVQLGRAADERKRRDETERAGEFLHGAVAHHSQV